MVSTLRSGITPEQVILGYRHGLFPMSRGRHGTIEWFMAEPRTIIPLDERFKVPRTVQKLIRKTDFEVSFNRDFPSVIRSCARHREVASEEVWLSGEMIDLYCDLHRLGFAHSVELHVGDDLVGGLYGVAIQGAFFGESMFSRVPSASQIALVALVERLRLRRFVLLDAQMRTPHIGRFGAIDLTHDEYLARLSEALVLDRQFAI
ncbi:MAG: leucyl/phenylalanyl-tRNA--protein transferase [Acidobacteriota bacterium]